MKTLLSALALTTVCLCSVYAAPPEKAAAPAESQKKTALEIKPVPQSIFGIPTKPVEGHDPFYPVSDRLFAVKNTPKPASSTVNTSLVFNGISGSKDHQFAMINGHTFAEGEEAPVTTAAGRVRVLLVAIKDERAIIEVGGERRELTLQGR